MSMEYRSTEYLVWTYLMGKVIDKIWVMYENMDKRKKTLSTAAYLHTNCHLKP